jgi:tetratricopeptide (TPR) repeat protein
VPCTIALRYHAFISYSHADARWAKWLHRKLEDFHLGDDLAGRETVLGRVPNTLRPIFRDRDEFAAGHSLSDQTLAALDDSIALIVICSPNAAKSHYVNEEIRLFKSRQADRLVIPLIVDDAPGAAQPQCFPPALAFKVTGDGIVTSTPEAILAADARRTGDGPYLSLAKIVASLIGVPVDDVRKRQAITQDWWIKVTASVIAVVAVLVMAAGFLVWEHGRERARQIMHEQRLEALVERLASSSPAHAAEAPDSKQAIARAVKAADKGAAADPKLARALDLLQQDKIAEAEALFRDVAEEREAASKTAGREAADAWRNLGAIAALSDPKKSREAYAHAVALEPDNVDGLIWHGWLQMQANDLPIAEKAYRRLIALESGREPGLGLYWARVGLGDIAVARGDLGSGKASYIEAERIADSLAKANSGIADWQNNLAILQDRIGKVLVAQGNLPAALDSHKASRAIRDQLVKADPGNAGWQRELSVSQENIGDVLLASDLPAALDSYKASLAIRDRLAQADPGNATWQRDLSVARSKIGDVLLAQGSLPAAVENYNATHATFERLVQADPGNASLKRELSVSQVKIGDVFLAQNNLPAALDNYKASLAMLDRLAQADPGNASLQHDISALHIKIGDVLLAQDNLPAALENYKASLAILDRLAQADPGNATWQRDLSFVRSKTGDVLLAQDNLPAALENYKASLAILDQLAQADPGNATWQRNLSFVRSKTGDVLLAQNNLPAALDNYKASLAMLDRFTQADPGNASLQRDISALHIKVGDVLLAQDNLPAALENYKASLAIRDRFVQADPGNAGGQRELALSHGRVGMVKGLQGDRQGALEAYQQGRDIIAQLKAQAPDNATLSEDLAWFEDHIAMLAR